MMAAVFFFCKFMDQLALMLIAVPVYSPLIVQLGFDPIWFWMLFLINITLGGITPPFGYTMFVFKSVRPEVSMTEIYWSAAPIVGVALLTMVLMSVFPQIVTWLPAATRVIACPPTCTKLPTLFGGCFATIRFANHEI
jgi:TRAP-type C4-dicarboxylate transport system permease large subunit